MLVNVFSDAGIGFWDTGYPAKLQVIFGTGYQIVTDKGHRRGLAVLHLAVDIFV
jgi:hypothetical protein